MNKDEFTNREFMLKVDGGHTLHVVDWGNKDAKTPFIYLHGGPGGFIKDKQKLNFDPMTQRVIFFDQRGCGESLPFGELKNNDIEHLASDITKIAEHLKIKKFYLFGYSWGSTLALYYTIMHPAKVAGLIIGGVYSGENNLQEMGELCEKFFPDRYEKFLMEMPEDFRDKAIEYHLYKALNGDENEQKYSVYWLNYLESTVANYGSDSNLLENYEDYVSDGTKIELHFVSQNCFMEKDFLLKNAHKIEVPTFIVQGRCDMVCPPDFAYKIHKEIKGSKLYFAISNHYYEREINSIFRAILGFL